MPGGVEARGVAVSLGGRRVLDGVSMEAPRGVLTCVLGPNGAGKTTLLKTLAGLLEPEEGVVLVDGVDLYRLGQAERARRVSYMAPSLPEPGLGQRVEEYVAASRYPLRGGLSLGPSPRDIEAARGALARLSASHLAPRRLSATSSGERQRAQLAHALVRGSGVLVVDEPTSFQDLYGRLLVYTALKREAAMGRAVVVATHDMVLAALYADRVVLLSSGRVVAEGPPGEALEPGLLEEVYGVEVEMARVAGRSVPIPVRPSRRS